MTTSRRARVDRLVVHQFDPARPSPGGIDTCLRGVAKYRSSDERLAFIGVDTGEGPASRRLGRWEWYEGAEGRYAFLPVVRLDPGDQRRRIPHSLRLILGIVRHRHRIPRARWTQSHRMDTGLLAPLLLGGARAYFIHTQRGGLTGDTSDSFWRRAGRVHEWLERLVVGRASHVVVFNEGYSTTVRQWNDRARFSPTWFDPDLIGRGDDTMRDPYRLVWVGRLEVPKDPALAISALEVLAARHPNEPWSLDLLGSGTLLAELEARVTRLGESVRGRIRVRGRVDPARVAAIMSSAGVFLMTSHPGYEGFPRVLVESMASGLPAVVTEGSDTGGMVENGRSGYVVSRDPVEIAERIRSTRGLDREAARGAASSLGAPAVIQALYEQAGEH